MKYQLVKLLNKSILYTIYKNYRLGNEHKERCSSTIYNYIKL